MPARRRRLASLKKQENREFSASLRDAI